MKKLLFYATCLLVILACSPKNEFETINMEASFPQNFGFDNMGLKAITSSINHSKNTMSTLYANRSTIADLKISTEVREEVSSHADDAERILVLVTWSQKEDPHWYGAKIPGKLISIESLISPHVLSDRKMIRYRLYDGEGIENNLEDSSVRMDNILSMKPALFPHE